VSKSFDPLSQHISDDARGQLTDDQRIERYALGRDEAPTVKTIVNPDVGFDPKSPGSHLMTNPEYGFWYGNQELIKGAKLRHQADLDADMEMRRGEAEATKTREEEKVREEASMASIAKDNRRQAVLAASRSSRERLSTQNVARLNAAKGTVLGGNALRSRGISRSGGGVNNFRNISDSVLG